MIDFTFFRRSDHDRRDDGARWSVAVADHGGTYRQVDARHRGTFGLPTVEQPLDVVRLDPALQKSGRHRNTRGIGLYTFEFHACEPTAVDRFANLGAQAPFDSDPAFVVE